MIIDAKSYNKTTDLREKCRVLKITAREAIDGQVRRVAKAQGWLEDEERVESTIRKLLEREVSS